jgi:hypothetical protein
MREMTYPDRTAKRNADAMAWSDSESDTWVIMDAHSFTAQGTRTGFKTMADVATSFFGNVEERDVDHPPAGQAETVKRKRTGQCDPAIELYRFALLDYAELIVAPGPLAAYPSIQRWGSEEALLD